ncbi:MAG: hexokinase [Syntrophomonadaceae bacterium]
MSLYDEILASLQVSPQLVRQVAGQFAAALSGVSGRCGLKMLDSRFRPPSGREQGEALALDFGGTNLGLFLVKLDSRSFRILKQKVVSIRPGHSGPDLAAEAADGEQLFDYIAAQLEGFVSPGRPYRLGHCFSFPFRQLSRNSGLLLEWTKEIKTRGVVGQDVNRLLGQALKRRGLDLIKPAAILNDTVATLLCAAYLDDRADLGSICGTGYNSCFRDRGGRIINVEAGNFFTDILPVNHYDLELDRLSHNRGHQRLEKMVSGAYLGELFRLMWLDLNRRTELSTCHNLLAGRYASPHSLDSRRLADLLSGGAPLTAPGEAITGPAEAEMLRSLALALTVRAARLIAATYAGIIDYLDPQLRRRHLISIDGSIYEKMPFFAGHIRTAIDEVWAGQAGQIEIRFMKDSSGLGAALAASMERVQ